MRTLIVFLVLTYSCLVGAPRSSAEDSIKVFKLTFLKNPIEIFVEDNEMGRSLHSQIQKILHEKELELLRLNTENLILTNSRSKSNELALQSSASSLENQLKNVLNNSTNSASNSDIKRRVRKIIRKIIRTTLRFLSRFFRTANAAPSDGCGKKPSEDTATNEPTDDCEETEESTDKSTKESTEESSDPNNDNSTEPSDSKGYILHTLQWIL